MWALPMVPKATGPFSNNTPRCRSSTFTMPRSTWRMPQVAFAQDPARRARRLAERCHDLKDKHGAAGRILREMEGDPEQRPTDTSCDKLTRAITCFQS